MNPQANPDFVARLLKAFDNATMADVARRLKIPHATVRNYYRGRLPAPDVLIKIANETGVSLNWLLIGTGEMYAGRPPVSLGRFIEDKIDEMIDRKVASIEHARRSYSGTYVHPAFDIDGAVRLSDDPQRVMSEWLRSEGRQMPADYGVAFFRGWESFTHDQKVAAVRDAKQSIDRVLKDPK
jgi:transcriptional regulator with XRE-family HTH domain